MIKEKIIMDEDIDMNNEEINNLIIGLLDKGANYSIKSMSVGEQLKELLLDVKKSMQDEEFKELLNSAINSSLREGLDIKNYNDYDFEEDDDENEIDENLGLSKKKINLNDISTAIKIAFEGGLPQLINLVIEMVTASKKKNNIFSNYIDEFVCRIKTYVQSEEFKKKVNRGVLKCSDKVEKFKGLCSAWYNAYDILNIEQIKEIAKELKEMKNKVKFDNECLNENEIIQNITDIITKKGEKVSKSRIDIYDNLHEI